jgi:hypothetical protein
VAGRSGACNLCLRESSPNLCLTIAFVAKLCDSPCLAQRARSRPGGSAIARTYETDETLSTLVDFLLSLDQTFTITFVGHFGAIVREIGSDDRAMLVTVTAEAEADACSPLLSDRDRECIADTISATVAASLSSEGLTEWDAIDYPTELGDEYPNLDFAVLEPATVVA